MKTLILLSIFLFNFQVLAGRSVSLMSYNVENLFDHEHDEGKDDYEYMPMAIKKRDPQIRQFCNSLRYRSWRESCLNRDWTAKKVDLKLKGLADVILSYENGADVLLFQEVENLKVLELLRKKLGADYKYVALVEGKDRRGIDNGIISRYPIMNTRNHTINITAYSKRPTRDILEADIEVEGKLLKVLVNHWPSQGSPSGARVEAAKVLAKIASKSKADLTIAAGDFNTLADEDPNAIKEHVLAGFFDAYAQGVSSGSKLPLGSHWYKGHWSQLDKILVHKKSKGDVDYRDFGIHKESFMLTDYEWTDYDTGKVTLYKGIPYRFNHNKAIGYSDHLPLVIKFRL